MSGHGRVFPKIIVTKASNVVFRGVMYLKQIAKKG